MGNSLELFNENDVNSIIYISKKISDMNNKRNVNKKMIKANMKQAINCLRAMENNEYGSQKTLELLYLVNNSANKIGRYLYSADMMSWLVNKLHIHVLYIDMLEYYHSKQDVIKIDLIIRTIKNVTADEFIVEENIAGGMVEITLKIIGLIIVDGHLINNNHLFSLYVSIAGFLFCNARVSSIKERLINLGARDILLKQKENIDAIMSRQKEEIDKLEMVNVDVVSALCYLLDDEQLEQEISTGIVKSLLRMVDKSIRRSFHNELKWNTKFYFNSGTVTTYACNYLASLLRISVNDRVKETIFCLNGVGSIIKIFKESKKADDQQVAAELLCSLCFNKNVKKELSRESVMMLLKEKLKSKNKSVVASCQQILGMIDNVLEQTIPVPKTSRIRRLSLRFFKRNEQTMGSEHDQQQQQPEQQQPKHVMISYCHQDKKNCLKLNELLKKKGYKTWIDVEHMAKYGKENT